MNFFDLKVDILNTAMHYMLTTVSNSTPSGNQLNIAVLRLPISDFIAYDSVVNFMREAFPLTYVGKNVKMHNIPTEPGDYPCEYDHSRDIVPGVIIQHTSNKIATRSRRGAATHAIFGQEFFDYLVSEKTIILDDNDLSIGVFNNTLKCSVHPALDPKEGFMVYKGSLIDCPFLYGTFDLPYHKRTLKILKHPNGSENYGSWLKMG